ncbi:DUF6157 family protein [Rhizohabitans arisaemae]|uniref:DUF6157 family protein n=1 Tax=Rhizohabitans arisaemae TaxID=2720610 RepID=UPI0024B168AE|nr:DUF6157 family protein [Rhizohabitans arisaemae]
MDMNYYRTFIAVADDCPVKEGVAPKDRGAKKTVAVLQYEMLAGRPFVHTQEDVLFDTWFKRHELPEASDEEIAALRAKFFSKPQACLRSSPLPKKHGWGLVFNAEGKIALCPMESAEYREHLATGTLKILKALRSSRT